MWIEVEQREHVGTAERRKAKVTRSGGVVEELRKIRRIMEELVGVMKRVASGLERRKVVGQEEEKNEVKREKDSVGQ